MMRRSREVLSLQMATDRSDLDGAMELTRNPCLITPDGKKDVVGRLVSIL
jgi:hypothetical protein